MRLRDLLRIANRNLLRNKLRTLLTILAIFVGSFTLVMTNAISDGMKEYVENQVKSIEGKNILFVSKKFDEPKNDRKIGEPVEYKEKTEDETGNVVDPNSYSVNLSQIDALKSDIPEIKTVTPRYDFDGDYITLDGIKKYQVNLGMLSEGVKQKVEVGSSINGSGEIVIPLELAKTLDSEIKNLVGKDVTIGYKTADTEETKTIQLRVVGVATKGFMASFISYVDSDTARRLYEEQQRNSENYNKFWNFTIQLENVSEKKITEVKAKLDEKGYSAETFSDRDKRTYDAIGILQIGLGFFAFIALLAASFGIINTLVVAVMERTKEIGLQKALGLGRGKIFLLFTLESVLIGFWGAVLGVIGGIVVGTIANLMTGAYLSSFEGYSLFAFRLFSIAWVVLLVCIIAFLAGVMPAFRASRLNPIEALRYE